ncbi:MAG: glycosyltransferase family 2 protein [Elioraea sp.]|nr:glycosyltransferase family 2 protein [Elioraea sp.]
MERVGVAVFAYNEERLIGGALDRFDAMRDEPDFEVQVPVNGCTDRSRAGRDTPLDTPCHHPARRQGKRLERVRS